MKGLAWLGISLLAPLCGRPTPPAQVVEPLPTVTEAPSGVPSDMPGPDGKVVAEPPPAPAEAFQSVSGTLDGKPWELRGAGTLGPIKDDGSVQILLANHPIDCAFREASPDDRTITLTIPWKARTRLGLGALGAKEAWVTAMDEKKKKPGPLKGWKPEGSLEVLSAPTRLKSSGRIRISLSGAKDSLTAEVPVKVCFGS